MSGTDKKSTKLPNQTADTVVDVSLKHVIIGFTVLVCSSIAVSTSIVLLRDYSKFRRQRALIEAVREIIHTVQGGSIGKADQTQNNA